MNEIPAAYRKAVSLEIQRQQNRVAQCQGIASGKVFSCFHCATIVGHYCSSYLQGLVDENGMPVTRRIIHEEES